MSKFIVGDVVVKVRIGGGPNMPLGFTAKVQNVGISVRHGEVICFDPVNGWYTTDFFELAEEFGGNV